MKRIYYAVRGNVHMIITDDGMERRMMTEISDGDNTGDIEEEAYETLESFNYFDDDDWEVYFDTVDELVDFVEIVAERVVDDD